MAGILEKYLDALLLSLKGASFFEMAAPAYDRAAWDRMGESQRQRLIREADECLKSNIPAMTIADYMQYKRSGDETAYKKNFYSRRKMMMQLAMGLAAQQTDRYVAMLAELVWAISEESSWMLPSNNALAMGLHALPLPDVTVPLVDAGVAETASELSMIYQIAGAQLDELTPQLTRRIEMEIQMRVITPFVTRGETDWMCGPKADTLKCLAGCMMAFLTFERDDRRRWACMRKAWLLLSKHLNQISPDGSVWGGLDGWLAVVEPIMECLSMVYAATGGEVDARTEPLIQRLCHFPVLMHLGNGWFVNPGDRSMKPALNGIQLFRIGVMARDSLLCDLGSYINRAYVAPEQELPPHGMMYRVFAALNQDEIDKETVKPPMILQSYLPGIQAMVARSEEGNERGLTVGMHGGDNGSIGCHLDIGDFALFSGGDPILVDMGMFADTDLHNLPLIGGMGQQFGSSSQATDVNCQLEESYALMSVNLARAYAEEAGVYSWQRTLILSREDGGAQLIDVFDLKERKTVQFHFITPCKPNIGDKYAQLGPVRMRWEADLLASSEELNLGSAEGSGWSGPLYHLELTSARPVDGGKYMFTFYALRTYG